MAWRTQAATNAGLVAGLRREGVFSSEATAAAMLAVDRGDFSAAADMAYVDAPHPIGHGATCSAPHMHAMALDLLAEHVARPGARVLDVGCGSGYTTALLCAVQRAATKAKETEAEQQSCADGTKKGGTAAAAAAAGGDGGATTAEATDSTATAARVVGVEVVPELAALSRANLERGGLGDALKSGEVEVHVGDGWLGHEAHAPYDAIHVGAAAEVLPPRLVAQLAPGGRMVVPVGSDHGQEYLQVDRGEGDDQGEVTTTRLFGVRYVPLVRTEQSKDEGVKAADSGAES